MDDIEELNRILAEVNIPPIPPSCGFDNTEDSEFVAVLKQNLNQNGHHKEIQYV